MNKRIGIFLLVLFLCVGYFFARSRTATPPAPPRPVVPTISSQVNNNWHLISDSVGEVANVFSWGFNRHICYDKDRKTFWIFYFRTIPQTGKPGEIVYRYSQDFGTSWSPEKKLTSLAHDGADFTISCQHDVVDVAYGDVAQNGVYWQRGKITDKEIDWFVKSIAMPMGATYTRAIPAIAYWQGLPVISAHDQSQQSVGGHKRAFVAIAKDADGKAWEKDVQIFDEVISAGKSTLAFSSVFVAKDKLFALSQSDAGLMLISYMGDNRWSAPELLKNIPYGGGTPEWLTLNDSLGRAHLLYPTNADSGHLRHLGHAIFDGQTWDVSSPVELGTIRLNQLAAGIDAHDHLIVAMDNIFLAQEWGEAWQQDKQLLANVSGTQANFLTMSAYGDDIFGLAWVDGEYTHPRVWFSCLQVRLDSMEKNFVSSCK